ncbi:hypothetical protein [Kitasatospora sp. MBT66]|uniref:hypothetical protein n=1 Tax=Kitasatospora sp. MBT66 TaxID=1444769 RepID=UPI0005BB5AD4|nr:hypothetical protein [Kitasatospora sp. MBT66]
MARIQVLPLPARPDDPAPFAFVIDETHTLRAEDVEALTRTLPKLKEAAGAHFVLVTDIHLDVT